MSCSDPVVFATFAGGSAKTKTTLGSSQESEAPRSSHPPPSHILVDSSFSRLYWVCLKVGYPFEESPGLSASFPFEEYPSFLYFTQPQIVGIPKKIIKNHNVQQYPLDYIHLSFISIIIRNWDPRDPLTIEKKTGWSYLGIHPPGHFWSGPSGCTTAVPVFRSRSVCADCLRSHGKKHPSVYGLYHPKKVGNFGNSLFLLQQQWMWKIPDNGRCFLGFPGHIFDNCQYQRSSSLWGLFTSAWKWSFAGLTCHEAANLDASKSITKSEVRIKDQRINHRKCEKGSLKD